MLFRSNDTATTEIYTEENTLSLHDALPISEAPELIRRNRPQANLTAPQRRRLQEFEDHWKQLQLVRADTTDRKLDYLAEPVRHLVLYTLQQKDLDQALTYAQQGLSLREAANFKTNLPFDHLLLSTIYQAKGDTTDALLHAQKASAIASEMEFEEAVASANKRSMSKMGIKSLV